jgi:acyl-CoA synthetase (AMP-forming)/AMP-acid ligase II
VTETLNGLLEIAAGARGGLRFLDRYEQESFHPWPAIVEEATAVAGALRARGIAPGDRVALVFPTGEEFVVALFAVLAAGAVPVPLYPPVRLGRLEDYRHRTARALAVSGARLVLVDPAVRAAIEEAVASARPPLGLAALAELPGAGPHIETVESEALGLVQFSSGTTVEPKPVGLSHRAICAQVRILNGFWPDRDGVEHGGVSWLPLYHDMGLIGCLFTALERPSGTLTLFSPELFVARPALWLRAISRYRATLSPAPNFAYALAAERVRDEELEGVDLSCWRVALNGAEPVAPQTLERFCERFARWGFRREAMTPVYGLSEAALAVTFSEPSRPPRSRRFERNALARRGRAVDDAAGRELVSLGRPVPGFELEIRDRRDRVLAERRVGRVWTRGPSLMSGYLGQPEATAKALRDGWLDTGDLGFLDRGELYLVGRAKDVLILRGRNHDPHDVEHAAAAAPGAREGCAVAVSHHAEGAASERLLVFVEHVRNASPDTQRELGEAARRAVLERTGLDPDEVVVLAPGSLPRTSSGKLRRQEALRRHLEGELDARRLARLASEPARVGEGR